MQKLLLSILVCFSVNSYWVNACWFEPYGETVRFSLLQPKYLNVPSEYAAFLYNADQFTFNFQESDYDENVIAWQKLVGNNVSKSAISNFLYSQSYSDFNAQSTNAFVRYLFHNKKTDILDYLKIAKECEPYNSVDYENDAWERKENPQLMSINRKKLITKIEQRLKTTMNEDLKRRYAFLQIRLEYYNQNYTAIGTTFNRYFSHSPKDFLYYWGLYFYCFSKESNSLDKANVLAHSPQKAQICYHHFHDTFSLREALDKAKDDKDRANAYIFASVQRLEPNLDYLQQIYQYNSKSKLLEFLLFREIQKLEDWIFTPYYTNYMPSTEKSDYWRIESKVNTTTARQRSEKDRLYAQKLLNFVQQVQLKKIQNPENWKLVEIQLLFMTRSFEQCIQKGQAFLKEHPNQKENKEVEQVMALAQIAKQTPGNVVISKAVQSTMQKNLKDKKFIFAIGRELEYLNQLPEAVAIFSLAGVDNDFNYYDEFDVNVWWRANHSQKSSNLFYFNNYFDYIDYTYSASQLQRIINYLDEAPKDEFHQMLFKQLQISKSFLFDLLGTKYIREDNLTAALTAFQSAGNEYWDKNYRRWERDKYDYGYWIFDANPFYDLKNTPDFISDRKDFRLSKLSVLEHLMDYIDKSNDPKNPKNAYYSFLVATCYYNMSQYGNSWMMRRFQSTTNFNWNQPSYIDEDEYRNNHLAQKYYHKAYTLAKDKKFKALCLRMEGFASSKPTPIFKQLKKEYPEYYHEVSNCYSLESYFKP